MEGMYDWPYYIPFDTHDNYPVPTRHPIPSPMDGGFYRDRVTPVYRSPYQPRTRTRTRIPTRSDYAVKIQKVFRGFRIRKNVGKIVELKRGVDKVARNLMEDDSIELILRDDRYRLKVTEDLMGLLLKLDSVVALNDAVRVCRKVVIRKAIYLQELIDSLVVETPIVEETLIDETLVPEETLIDETLVPEETLIDEETLVPIVETLDEEPIVETLTLDEEPIVEETPIEEETLVTNETMQVEDKDSESEDEEAWECVDDDGKIVDNVEFEKEEDGKQGWLVVEEEDNKVLMSKMAEDNRKLMEMIVELCNKNDNQARLIQTLSKRVDKLEQALNDRITTKTDKKKSNR